MNIRHIAASALIMSSFVVNASTLSREEAVDFLYKSMSLPDSVDYPRSFYLSNVDASLRARKEMPWGATVPDREFKHFVLPVRVNNEKLDNSRLAFYDALRDRVKNLSMEDAILEVNHWCHEHVTYRPSDGRTSSPLSAVSQAIGRCGEESTFTVAALRSVGIPARQIYTPRWAHTDDNHAWVEAWANGRWYFLGACEPEPVLNSGWFNAPASRGLLMSTDVPGDYQGPEETLDRLPLSTRINVTSNYAPVATLPVKAVYADGSPAAGAKVCFCIYNYAEYFPAVVKTADTGGSASLKGGLGDFVVWATDGSKFGVAKGSPRDYADASGTMAPVTVVLDKDDNWEGAFELDIVPPAQGRTAPAVSEQQRRDNDAALQREDSIRDSYTSGFISGDRARWQAWRLGLDENKMAKVLTESRGNHDVLLMTLVSLPDGMRRQVLDLLCNVTEKDRRDIRPDVVLDHARHAVSRDALRVNDKIYGKYILSPRIEIENLTPWREELSTLFDAGQAKNFRERPELIAEWINTNISRADSENPRRLRMSPGAVMRTRKGDKRSMEIFYVALARTLGVPARIDGATGAVQYMDVADGCWKTVKIGGDDIAVSGSNATGQLLLTYTPEGYLQNPSYYRHFSISKIDGGIPHQLEYDEDATAKSLMDEKLLLEPGQYIVTSGQRMADGSVLARSEVVVIPADGKVERRLVVRSNTDGGSLPVIGSLNAENRYRDASGEMRSILSTTGRGFYVAGFVTPGHEPTVHALNDLSAVAKQLGATGRKVLLLTGNAERLSRLDLAAYPGLIDAGVEKGEDTGAVSISELAESTGLEPGIENDPVFVIADSFNRVVWMSKGYTIGLGERILEALHGLE